MLRSSIILQLQQSKVDAIMRQAATAAEQSDATRSNAPNVCHDEHHIKHNHPNRPVHFRHSQANSQITPYT